MIYVSFYDGAKTISHLLAAGCAVGVGIRETEGMQVRRAADRAGPNQSVISVCARRTISVSNLLPTRIAGSVRFRKSAGIKVDRAAGRPRPEKRMIIVSRRRTRS